MMSFNFKVIKRDAKSLARAGLMTTPHGKIKTPCFSPVATRASVRALSPHDLRKTKSQVILANTYHLFLKPGIKIIKKFGGFGPFMGWQGPTITDSGGYQVSFLWGGREGENLVKRITDEGAYFKSYLDGSVHLLTPEKSMAIQKALGADIMMAFDQPLGQDFGTRQIQEAFNRTLKWEERSFVAWQKLNKKGHYQALYGIIHGGLDKNLLQKSLRFVLETGFPGIALGGETIGANPQVTCRTLDAICDNLPKDRPVHALGLGGGPEGVLEAIKRGIDTFDNTGITRMARTGLLFIQPEDGGNRLNKFRIDIKKAKFKEDKKPIGQACTCYTCVNYNRAYLHHLLTSGEILGLRLATIHNVFFINSLLAAAREAIIKNDFEKFCLAWFSR